MLTDPNVAYLGSETYNTQAKLVFADGDLDVFSDSIDPQNDLDWHWSVDADFTAGTLSFVDEATGTDAITLESGSPVSFATGLDLGGPLTSANIGDDIIQFSAIGGNSGDATILEFRASDTDWDQIVQFERQSNSSYELYVHEGGNPERVLTTGDDDILREGEEPYVAVSDDGTSIHGGPTGLDFGADLGVTDNGDDTLTIDYTGGTVPGRVRDDGTSVSTDANGLDFGNRLNVAMDADNFAVVDIDESGLLYSDTAETVSADWTFDGAVTLNGAVDVAQTITGSIDHALEADHALDADLAADADAVGGVGLAGLAELGAAETITAEWSHDAAVRINNDNNLWFNDSWRFWTSTTNGTFYLELDGSGAVIEADDTGVELLNPTTNGNALATQTWVENSATANHAASADHATNADHATDADSATTADSATNADDATLWDGHEIVIDGTPDTNQYILMETQ